MITYEDLIYFQESISEDTNTIDALMTDLKLLDTTANMVAVHGITEYGKEMMSSICGDLLDYSSINNLATSMEGLVKDIWEGIKKFFQAIWDSIVGLLTRKSDDEYMEKEIKKAKAEGAKQAKETFLDKAKLNSRKDHFMKKVDLITLMDKTILLVESIPKIHRTKKLEIDPTILGVNANELKSMFAAEFIKKGNSKVFELVRLDPDTRDKKFQLQPDEVLFSTIGWKMDADLVDEVAELVRKYKNNIVSNMELNKMPLTLLRNEVKSQIDKLEQSAPDKSNMTPDLQEQIRELKIFAVNLSKILVITFAAKFIINKQIDLLIQTINFAKESNSKS